MIYDGFDDDVIFKRKCIGKKLTFICIPQRCHVTGKILWLTKVYKATAAWGSFTDVIYEHRYYDKKEFMFLVLKGKI